jgi:hypothetical protein
MYGQTDGDKTKQKKTRTGAAATSFAAATLEASI